MYIPDDILINRKFSIKTIYYKYLNKKNAVGLLIKEGGFQNERQ